MKYLSLSILLLALWGKAIGAEADFSLVQKEHVVPSPKMGPIVPLMAKDKDGRQYGPLLVWKTPFGTRQLTNRVSVANEFLQKIIAEERSLSTDITQSIPRKALGIVELGASESSGSFFIQGWLGKQYLAQLKAAAGPEAYAKLATLLPDYTQSISGNEWKATCAIVTESGAIEWHTVSGKLQPVSLDGYEQKNIAPSGTVPKFEFRPQPNENL